VDAVAAGTATAIATTTATAIATTIEIGQEAARIQSVIRDLGAIVARGAAPWLSMTAVVARSTATATAGRRVRQVTVCAARSSGSAPGSRSVARRARHAVPVMPAV
jgi:hypothetical protein